MMYSFHVLGRIIRLSNLRMKICVHVTSTEPYEYLYIHMFAFIQWSRLKSVVVFMVCCKSYGC